MEMLDNESLKRHSRSASPELPPSEKRHKEKHHKDNRDKKEKKDKQHKKEKKEKHHKEKEHKQHKHRSKDRKDKEKSRSERGDASPYKDDTDERAMAETHVKVSEELASGNLVSKFYGMASSESEPEPGEIEEPGAASARRQRRKRQSAGNTTENSNPFHYIERIYDESNGPGIGKNLMVTAPGALSTQGSRRTRPYNTTQDARLFLKRIKYVKQD